MFAQIKRWLQAPCFPGDEGKTTQARIINTVGLYFVLALIAGAVVLVPFFVEHRIEAWAIVLMLAIVYGISRYLLFRGRLALSVTLMIASAWVVGIGVTIVGGGIASPMLFVVMATTIFIGFLLEPRIGTGFVFATILAGLGMAVLQENGIAPPQVFVFWPMATWSMFALALLFVHAVMNLIVRNLRDALARAREQNAARLQAEATLRESERKFRSIAGNIPGMVYQLRVRSDGSTYFSYVSPRAAELFGLLADTSSPDWEVGALVHPDDRESFSASVAQAIATRTNWNYEGRIITHAGQVKWFRGIASPAQIGDELAFDGILVDITERKRAEAALLKASLMDATATLAGGIAHKINNLMTGVVGNAEFLRIDFIEHISAAQRQDAREMLATVSRSAQEAGHLAWQMLAFARGGKYQPRPMDLNDKLCEVLRLQVQEHALPANVHVDRRLAPDLWGIEADATQMSQMFVNLFVNAIEAIEGVDRATHAITVTTRNVMLDEAFCRRAKSVHPHPNLDPGPYVCLSLQDTGCGMSEQVLSRLFEPFFSTKSLGRGLGLAAVYGIVENHDGHVLVHSEEGQGATFEIYLPAVQVGGEPTGSQSATETYGDPPAA